MPCYQPISMYRSKGALAPGATDRSLTPNAALAAVKTPILVPCGRCIGCRIMHTRSWALRCINESTLHVDNCFLTLTYDNNILNKKHDNLDRHYTLNKIDVPLFLKRLRHHTSIRYYHCADYGEINQRPHHHLILFGYSPNDLEPLYSTSKYTLFTSPLIADLWGWGNVVIGPCTPESILYTCKYVISAIKGDKADAHYGTRLPPFATMSRRPGIGHGYLLKNLADFYSPTGYVDSKGYKNRTPAYYDSVLEKINPYALQEIKNDRRQHADTLGLDYISRRRAEAFAAALDGASRRRRRDSAPYSANVR